MAANSISRRSPLILMLAAAFVWPPALIAQNSDDDEPVDAEVAAPLHRLWSQLTIAAPSRVRLLEELSWKVDDVDAACRLTEGQKEKLRLAGRGDVKRFLDRVDAVQARLQSAQTSEYDEIGNECDSLKRLLKPGLFEDGSYFAKIRQRILTADQLAKLDAEMPVDKLTWTEDLDEAKALAAAQNRPVLIYVRAKWCLPCRQVERMMMQSAVIRRYLCRKFVLVSIDVDKNPNLAREFGIKSIPAHLIVTAKGELLARVEGLQADESTFLNRLEFTALENERGPKTGDVKPPPRNQAADR